MTTSNVLSSHRGPKPKQVIITFCHVVVLCKKWSRTVKSTMISHWPLFYLFTVRKHVGQ